MVTHLRTGSRTCLVDQCLSAENAPGPIKTADSKTTTRQHLVAPHLQVRSLTLSSEPHQQSLLLKRLIKPSRKSRKETLTLLLRLSWLKAWHLRRSLSLGSSQKLTQSVVQLDKTENSQTCLQALARGNSMNFSQRMMLQPLRLRVPRQRSHASDLPRSSS